MSNVLPFLLLQNVDDYRFPCKLNNINMLLQKKQADVWCRMHLILYMLAFALTEQGYTGINNLSYSERLLTYNKEKC